MAVTQERFAQGLSFQEYIAQMQQNQEKFVDNYDQAELAGDAVNFVCNLNVPLNVMIITEDWCGDALTYVPVFGRLAECSDCWDMKVFLRDQNLDLADQYLKEGKYRAVPVFVFFDENMNELGSFIERPGSVNAERQHLIDTWAERHSDVIAPGRAYTDQSPEGQALLAEPLRELRMGRLRRWQQACVEEIMHILSRLEREPVGAGA